ncbi:di-heme-cytochrome C peroxidase [Sorangium sp. So ce1182]|uniref:di-heme-cytochrome C peroxidase n=1 Tax=Sorangium sp. So ce1182 TaxID=3133334 RepID=UPI003F5EDDEA
MNRLSIALVLIGLGAACSGRSGEEGPSAAPVTVDDKRPPADLVWPDAPPAGRETLKGGVSEEKRQDFYHLGEGSELFPLTWLLAATQENGEPFIKDLGRYGLLPDKKSPGNPAGLPIGLTSSKVRGMPEDVLFVGVNCAACHVGQIESAGKAYVIDGAPNLFNVEQFFSGALSALADPFRHPSKLWAFLKRTSEYSKALKEQPQIEPQGGDASKAVGGRVALGQADPRLRLETIAQLDRTPDLESMQKGDDAERALVDEMVHGVRLEARVHVEGDGNADLAQHLESIRKKAPGASSDRIRAVIATFSDYYEAVRLFRYRLGFFVNRYEAATESNTPGGFGRTDAWGTVRSEHFDNKAPANAPLCYPHLWGFAQDKYLHWIANTGSVMERNIGQAIGLTAAVDGGNYESTVNVANLNQLEVAAYDIQPPRWSDTNLPPINEAKKARGEKIFKGLCQDCHEKPRKESHDEKEWRDLAVTPYVGTDPTALVNFNRPVVVNGVETPFPAALKDMLGKVQKAAYAHAKVSDATAKAWEQGRGWIDPLWRTSKGYVARPLAGIWASAPYLHNGSVPTLDALLRPSGTGAPGAATLASGKTPEGLRPRTFGIGIRAFDPVKVGYVDTEDKRYEFKTSLPGNGNAGHEGAEYGTALSEPDRASLIEYLKSL